MNLIIFGASGHAKVILDIISENTSLNPVGIIDNRLEVGKKILGVDVIGDDDLMAELTEKYNCKHGVIGVGDNFLRRKIVKSVENLVPDLQFVNCIHHSARISKNCQLGVGNVIMPGVVINAGSRVGNHCILNTNSSLDHDCEMDDYSSLAPNVGVAGDCRIGSFSKIGIGASVFPGVKIGSNCIIGGGSVLNRDAKDNAVYYGVPARYISERKLVEK